MSPAEKARLRAGREAVEDLRRYSQTIDRARFLSDRDAQRQVLHALFVAVQAAVDEALAAGRRLRLPGAETYRGAFEALGQAKAIPAEWVPVLMDWASFRNVVAHFYPVVDPDKVYEAIGEIGALERFFSWCEEQAGKVEDDGLA